MFGVYSSVPRAPALVLGRQLAEPALSLSNEELGHDGVPIAASRNRKRRVGVVLHGGVRVEAPDVAERCSADDHVAFRSSPDSPQRRRMP